MYFIAIRTEVVCLEAGIVIFKLLQSFSHAIMRMSIKKVNGDEMKTKE